MDHVARTPAQLGPILKGVRQQRGLTQQAAGAGVGLKQGTVSAIERDAARTGVESLYKLLSALGLELVLRDKAGTSDTTRSAKREW
ncbi:MAG: helix-turn-helix domain-containing protein [Gammaproteobacteria bacterium]|nr:helix-turn-helix domain-containing protein [Gammaproteobacteria bacterium]